MNSSGGMNRKRNSFGLRVMCSLREGKVSRVLVVIWISGSGKGSNWVVRWVVLMISSRVRMVYMVCMRVGIFGFVFG